MAGQVAHRIQLDLTQPLVKVPADGHNRWHPDIPPIARITPGEAISVDLRDGLDLLVTAETVESDLLSMDMNRGHPLTGPFFIEGAEPGDYLEVEVHEVTTSEFGFTCIIPGFGLLGDEFPEPFVVKWTIHDGVARSGDIPGIAIRGAPFLGLVGVAPSARRLKEFAAREADLVQRGGFAMPPDPKSAVPADDPVATEGLRTIPPRETGGNMDIKHIRAGSKLTLPVDVEGALLSLGDVHFAQGDGESCGVAIEVAGAAVFSCQVRKAAATTWKPRYPTYEFRPNGPNVGVTHIATTGVPVGLDGVNADLDVYTAAQAALREMIDYLEMERRYARRQAYIIVSVAADLEISSIVNVPNPMVSAVLPTSIFVD